LEVNELELLTFDHEPAVRHWRYETRAEFLQLGDCCSDGLDSLTSGRLEVNTHCFVEGVRKDGSVTTGKILEADPMWSVDIEKRDLQVAFRIVLVVIRLVPVLDLVHLNFCHENTVATCTR
jgi:hypothetical protein